MISYFKKFSAKIDGKGFTVLEVLVALGIFSFLAIAAAELFLTSWRYNSIIWSQLQAQNEGRKTTQDFINELRTASISTIGAYPLAQASSTAITFYSNPDTDTLRERIRYFMSSTTLKRGLIKPTGVPFIYDPANEIITDVAHNVANTSTPIFTYFDSSYSGGQNPLPDPVDIPQVRMVKIFLQLDQDPSASPVPFVIEDKVLLRNLKDN